MATKIFNPTDTIKYITKVQVGDKLYYFSDDEARKLLDQLGTAAKKDVAAGVSSTDEGLVTGAMVASAISNLEGAMHFRAVITKNEGETDTQAINRVITDPAAGDVVVVGLKEYVYAADSWHELGDEGIYALKSVTIGTQDLSSNISLDTLKVDLGLGDLAYKSSAVGTVAGQTISGVKATGTSTGKIDVVLDQTTKEATLTRSNLQPTGSVSGTVIATGSVSIAKNDEGTQISGTVSTPDITVTPATTSAVQVIDSVGTQASFTEGTFTEGTAASFTQGSKASWSASVDEDTETLSFNFSANGDDTFTANVPSKKAADTFVANELPTKKSAGTLVTGITSAVASQPTFTGDKFAATFTGNQSGDAISATFSGDVLENAGVSKVEYKEASVNATDTKFTGQSIELNVGDIAVAEKSVTVS